MLKFDDKNRKIKRHVVNSLCRSDAVMTASGLAALLSSALSGCVTKGAVQVDVDVPAGAIQASLGKLFDASNASFSGLTHYIDAILGNGGNGDSADENSVPFSRSLYDSLNKDFSVGLQYDELLTSSHFSGSSSSSFKDVFSMFKGGNSEADEGYQFYYESSGSPGSTNIDAVLVYDASTEVLVVLKNNPQGSLSDFGAQRTVGESEDSIESIDLFSKDKNTVYVSNEKDALMFSNGGDNAVFTIVSDHANAKYDYYYRDAADSSFGDLAHDSTVYDLDFGSSLVYWLDGGEKKDGGEKQAATNYKSEDNYSKEFLSALLSSGDAEFIFDLTCYLNFDTTTNTYIYSSSKTTHEMLLIADLSAKDPTNDGHLMTGNLYTAVYNTSISNHGFDLGLADQLSVALSQSQSQSDLSYELLWMPKEGLAYKEMGLSFLIEGSDFQSEFIRSDLNLFLSEAAVESDAVVPLTW